MVQLRIKVALRSSGLMSLISSRSGLKKYRKAAAISTSFTFWVASRATVFPVEPTWLFIFSFGLKLVHVGVSTFVCNREVLNRDFLVQILVPSVCVFTLCEF